MKKVRILLASAAILVGVSAAVAGKRAGFEYVNLNDDGTFTQVSSYNPSKCSIDATFKCEYNSPTNIGSSATEAQLQTAGATPSSVNKVYVP